MRSGMPPEITGGGGIVAGARSGALGFPPQRETFREGALLAANLGRDSDVVAAVYGQTRRRPPRRERDSRNLA